MSEHRKLPVLGVTRREFLEISAAGAALTLLPIGCGSSPVARPTFFTDAERKAMNAFANHIVPADQTPGAADLGAVDYIETLLTAFEVDPPMIHAGGPFSGRQPFSMNGTATGNFPSNDFSNFLPLPRTSVFAWRLRIYGSSYFAGGAPNDKELGAVVGLRDQFRKALGDAAAAAPAPIDTLDDTALAAVWNGLPADFRDTFLELLMEGLLAPPEYGGNRNGGGWKLVNFEGDSQPLGYSQFDPSTMTFHERSDAPLTTINPGDDPAPLDATTMALLASIVGSQGGRGP